MKEYLMGIYMVTYFQNLEKVKKLSKGNIAHNAITPSFNLFICTKIESSWANKFSNP